MFDWVAFALLVVGGINWGIISIFSTDIVSYIFGEATMLTRLVYGIVGLSALYSVVVLSTKATMEDSYNPKISTI